MITIMCRGEAATFIRTERSHDVLKAMEVWNRRLADVGSEARIEEVSDLAVLPLSTPKDAIAWLGRQASIAENRVIDGLIEKGGRS